MKIDLLDRPRLELLNKKGPRYNLQDAEKDYFMAIILNILYNSKYRESVVFKGGTAIYHCYLEQMRFSKDIDFSSRARLTPLDIKRLFQDYDIFRIKDVQEKRFGLDVFLQYRGPLGQADTIGIDINTNQKVLMEPRLMEYKNYYGVKFSCLVMDIREIFAEKIRTLNDRARPRDLYDLVVLHKRFDIGPKDSLILLSQKELHNPLKRKIIEENIDISLGRWNQEMKDLYYREIVSTEDVRKLTVEILRELD